MGVYFDEPADVGATARVAFGRPPRGLLRGGPIHPGILAHFPGGRLEEALEVVSRQPAAPAVFAQGLQCPRAAQLGGGVLAVLPGQRSRADFAQAGALAGGAAKLPRIGAARLGALRFQVGRKLLEPLGRHGGRELHTAVGSRGEKPRVGVPPRKAKGLTPRLAQPGVGGREAGLAKARCQPGGGAVCPTSRPGNSETGQGGAPR